MCDECYSIPLLPPFLYSVAMKSCFPFALFRQPLTKNRSVDRFVKLLVGGQSCPLLQFATLRDTLLKSKSQKLKDLISGLPNEDGLYVIRGDFVQFHWILNFLRDGDDCCFPEDACILRKIEYEAAALGIGLLVDKLQNLAVTVSLSVPTIADLLADQAPCLSQLKDFYAEPGDGLPSSEFASAPCGVDFGYIFAQEGITPSRSSQGCKMLPIPPVMPDAISDVVLVMPDASDSDASSNTQKWNHWKARKQAKRSQKLARTDRGRFTSDCIVSRHCCTVASLQTQGIGHPASLFSHRPCGSTPNAFVDLNEENTTVTKAWRSTFFLHNTQKSQSRVR